jgi:starch-binding outer membrane protein, SusD/RagB family
MLIYKKIKLQAKFFLFLTLPVLVSCEKLIETEPVGVISTDNAYDNEKNIEASVNGIYYKLQQTGSLYNGNFYTIYAALSDEAKVLTPAVNSIEFSTNQISVANMALSNLWNNAYDVIYQCNSLIENVTPKTDLNTVKKNQFLGEARFLRAYSYFMLVQYFGEVPLAIGSDYRVNNTLSRSPVAEINDFITDELEESEALLPDGFNVYGGVRTRITKQAAQALNARQYLYRENWNKAIEKSSLLIVNNTFSLPGNFDDVLKSNSPESIFELWFSSLSAGTYNYTAGLFVPNISLANPATPGFLPSDKLVNAFETNPVTFTPDKRKAAFIRFQATPSPGYNYLFKYRDRTTNSDQPKFFRLAEQYLIRAEARAQLNLPGAADDIDVIRLRAGLPKTVAVTQSQLLDAVAQERFVELCFEGHRWPDLIRTGKADAVLRAYKPSTWQPTDKLLPIPATEIGRNPNLNPQNPGYQNN